MQNYIPTYTVYKAKKYIYKVKRNHNHKQSLKKERIEIKGKVFWASSINAGYVLVF